MLFDFKENNIEVIEMKEMRGGVGSCTLHKQKNLPPKYIMISKIYVHPNSSIGEHIHNGNYETVFVESGYGKVIDDGKEILLKPGMVNICLDGHSHSIINTTNEDLIIIGIVKEN